MHMIINQPNEYYRQFCSVKDQFKQLQRFDINDPAAHRVDWALKFEKLLADCTEAAYTHYLHTQERVLQRIVHGGLLAAGAQARAFIQEMPTMRKQYFFFHSHLSTAAQECRDGEKMGEIVAHLGSADVSLRRICDFDARLQAFLKKCVG